MIWGAIAFGLVTVRRCDQTRGKKRRMYKFVFVILLQKPGVRLIML